MSEYQWIDGDRILSKVAPSLFQTGPTIISEMVQNAWRAGSTHVAIECTDKTLNVKDNGHGVEDVEALRTLLTLGGSGFEAEPLLAKMSPAGMGIYSLISHCKHMTIASGFGTLEIDCGRWFKDADYRDSTFDRIRPETEDLGLLIQATGLKKPLHDTSEERGFNHRFAFLRLYARVMDLFINGCFLEPFRPEEFFQECVSVDGADCWFMMKDKGHNMHDALRGIDPSVSMNYNYYSFNAYKHRLAVGWYHHLIEPPEQTINYSCYVDVLDGTPFTPKLPDRNTVIKDDKWNYFTCDRLPKAIADRILEVLPHMRDDKKGVARYVSLLENIDRDRYKAESPFVYRHDYEQTKIDIISLSHDNLSDIRKVSSLVHRDSIPQYIISSQELSDTRIPVVYEDGSHVSKDGERFWVETTNNAPFLVNTLMRMGISAGVDSVNDPSPKLLSAKITVHEAKEVKDSDAMTAHSAALSLTFDDGVTKEDLLPDRTILFQEGWENIYNETPILIIGEDPVAVLYDHGNLMYRYLDEHSDHELEKDLDDYIDNIVAKLQQKFMLHKVLEATGVQELFGSSRDWLSIDLSRPRSIKVTRVPLPEQGYYTKRHVLEKVAAVGGSVSEDLEQGQCTICVPTD